MSIIMGIDPGSIRTGWGVVSTAESSSHKNSGLKCLGFGVIEMPAAKPLAVRLGQLQRELTDLVLKFQPQAMSIEKIFMAKNADSAFKLGHARGVAMAIAGGQGIEVVEYATRSAKKMLTGSGGANKEQVQFLIQHMLGIRTSALDATDALCLAVAHAREQEVAQALARQNKVLGREL